MRIQTSEYCAVGHPDRTCDYIVSYILDRYLERDPNARVGLECQLKDSFATLSGEVSSLVQFMDRALVRYVREAITKIGYTNHYRDKWGHENAISGDDVQVALHLSQQSADISRGVNDDGWGDQGIFFGYAVRDQLLHRVGQHPRHDVRRQGQHARQPHRDTAAFPRHQRAAPSRTALRRTLQGRLVRL